MNILLFVIQDTYTGGAECVLHQVADYYLKKGNEVYVLFYMAKKYGHWEDVNKPQLHLLYGGGLGNLVSNILELRKVKFDYSYSSLVDLTGMLGFFRRMHLVHIKTMVGRESTSIFDRFKGFGLWRKKMMYYLGYPAVDVLICQTNYMKARLLHFQSWIDKNSKVVVIPNPVDARLMKIMGQEDSNDIPNFPYIVTAGRFIHEKGYDILIDAFNILKKNLPELKLVILGDGDLRKSLEDQVKTLGLKDDVMMPGFSKNVYPWFRNAKLCVISSRVEGFPNVLLQMMSQNERVVSTLCAGDIDKIKGLTTSLSNDFKALAAAMEKSLSQNETKTNRDLFDEELKGRSIDSFINKVETS